MRKFGLIGCPLEHSFSKKYFADKFRSEGITDSYYENFALTDIEQLPGLIHSQQLNGLNVTIPYKEKVISYLHETDEVVQSLKACNCIKVYPDGKLKGFNTDVTGFRISLKDQLTPRHNRALILGEGGAAKAVRYVLEELGIPYLTVSRRENLPSGTIHYRELTNEMVARHPLIINTTPVGMFPRVNACPPIPYEAIGKGHFLFDLIYNPETTLFLKKGEERGALTSNGYRMLVLQAEAAWQIWNSKEY